MTARPVPSRSEWTVGYWDAAAQRRLVVQACAACGTVRGLPRIMCPRCGSLEHTWLDASGTGTIFTWTVLRRSFHEAFTNVPIVIVVVELDDHPEVHLVSNLLDLPPGAVATAEDAERFFATRTRVRVDFEELDGVTLPQFRLVGDE